MVGVGVGSDASANTGDPSCVEIHRVFGAMALTAGLNSIQSFRSSKALAGAWLSSESAKSLRLCSSDRRDPQR